MSSNTLSVRQPRWHRIWLAVIASVLLILVSSETVARSMGYHPSIRDDPTYWSAVRHEVETSTNPKIIFLGASRSAYAFDLEVIETHFPGTSTAQLSIRGASPLPVLRSLANSLGTQSFDETTGRRQRGVIVVSLAIPSLEHAALSHAQPYIETHEQHANTVTRLERRTVARIEEHLAFFQLFSSSKQIVFRSLLGTSLSPSKDSQVMFDRSVFAPRETLQTTAGLQSRPSLFAQYRDNRLAQKISLSEWNDQREELLDATRTLKRAGYQVIYLRLPSSGEFRGIEDELYPRDLYWQTLESRCVTSGCVAIHSDDFEALRQIETPDGSHIAGEDRRAFTQATLEIIAEYIRL